jgi:hypothetical protein
MHSLPMYTYDVYAMIPTERPTDNLRTNQGLGAPRLLRELLRCRRVVRAAAASPLAGAEEEEEWALC